MGNDGLEAVLGEGDLVLVEVEAMDDMAAGREGFEQTAGTAGWLEHAHRAVQLRAVLLHDALDEARLLLRIIRIHHVVIQRRVVPRGGGLFRGGTHEGQKEHGTAWSSASRQSTMPAGPLTAY